MAFASSGHGSLLDLTSSDTAERGAHIWFECFVMECFSPDTTPRTPLDRAMFCPFYGAGASTTGGVHFRWLDTFHSNLLNATEILVRLFPMVLWLVNVASSVELHSRSVTFQDIDIPKLQEIYFSRTVVSCCERDIAEMSVAIIQTDPLLVLDKRAICLPTLHHYLSSSRNQ